MSMSLAIFQNVANHKYFDLPRSQKLYPILLVTIVSNINVDGLATCKLQDHQIYVTDAPVNYQHIHAFV